MAGGGDDPAPHGGQPQLGPPEEKEPSLGEVIAFVRKVRRRGALGLRAPKGSGAWLFLCESATKMGVCEVAEQH